jgi:chemotaxis protein MotB
MMPPAGRVKPADEGGSWLTTFGDMVTLLFTFFVLVYSFCSYDPGDWETSVGSIKGALGVIPGSKGDRVVPGGGSGSFPGHLGVIPLFSDPFVFEENRREQIKEEVARIREELAGTEGIEVEVTQTGYLFRIAAPILFEVGSAETKPAAKPFLAAIAKATYQAPGTIIVTGHTCDLPISTAEYESNWELSARRATHVLRLIKADASPQTRFVAMARGQYEPLIENRTELCRARNRRVEIRFDLEGGLPLEP